MNDETTEGICLEDIFLLGIRSRSEQIVPSGSCFRLRLYDPILYWKHKKPFSFVRLSKHQALQVVDLRCATKHLWPPCTQRQNMYTTIYTMHDFSSWVITDDISCVHIIMIITSFTLWHVQGEFLKSTLWKWSVASSETLCPQLMLHFPALDCWIRDPCEGLSS